MRYVRREVRRLTESDREATLNAMQKLWTVDGKRGRDLYGEQFASIAELAEAHALMAGAKVSRLGFNLLYHRSQPPLVRNFWHWALDSPFDVIPYHMLFPNSDSPLLYSNCGFISIRFTLFLSILHAFAPPFLFFSRQRWCHTQ